MEIPLFPLGSVLFPKGRMPLQIFERRYLDLVTDCMKNDTGFGIAWIVRGQEVAQPGVGLPNLGHIGTYAKIVDWDSLPNGLLGITIEGSQCFTIKDCHAADSQLVIANVEMLDLGAAEPVIEEWQTMLDVLSTLEVHPHVLSLGMEIDRNDAWQVGQTLAQLLPVDEALKYELLQIREVAPFMERLDQYLNMLGGVEA